MSAAAQKQHLRVELRTRRNQLTDRESRSAAICAQLAGLPAFVSAQTVHSYLPIGSEVDVRPLLTAALKAGKQVAVPIVRSRSPILEHSWITSLEPAHFTRGALGTPVPQIILPSRPPEWDLILVPLLGFDRQGYRLGYGAGHYDRLLPQTRGAILGVAFSIQEIATIPHEAHDVPLPAIMTETAYMALAD